MVVIAPVLMAVVMLYWLALCATIWFWGNALFALLKGHFIRASIWFSLGCGALFWWKGSEVIPHPWDFDAWLRGSAALVGTVVVLVLLGKLIRWEYRRRQALQAVSPSGTMPTGNVIPFPKVTLRIGFNEQIFGVNGQILGRDQSDQGASPTALHRSSKNA